MTSFIHAYKNISLVRKQMKDKKASKQRQETDLSAGPTSPSPGVYGDFPSVFRIESDVILEDRTSLLFRLVGPDNQSFAVYRGYDGHGQRFLTLYDGTTEQGVPVAWIENNGHFKSAKTFVLPPPLGADPPSDSQGRYTEAFKDRGSLLRSAFEFEAASSRTQGAKEKLTWSSGSLRETPATHSLSRVGTGGNNEVVSVFTEENFAVANLVSGRATAAGHFQFETTADTDKLWRLTVALSALSLCHTQTMAKVYLNSRRGLHA